MTDHVRLNEMIFFGYHGVLSEERKLGQRFVVDVDMETELGEAGLSDNLTKTVNYAEVFEVVKAIVTGPPRLLIEAVAEQVAATVLERFPLVQAVTVSIKKPSVPIASGVLASSEVEIRRARSA